MADPIKPEVKAKVSRNVEDLQDEQNRLRDELFVLRNNKNSKPEDVAALKAKLGDAVAATRSAEEKAI